MTNCYRASETGSTLFAAGAEDKFSFFEQSYILQDPESVVDPTQTQFDVAPDDFFVNSPRLLICVNKNSLVKSLAEHPGSITLSVILKEQISKRSHCVSSIEIFEDGDSVTEHAVSFSPDQFSCFSLTGDIYVDIVATVADYLWVKRIIGFKRFNLMFGVGKGLFTPIPKPKEFFAQNGAGEDTLWLVSISATGPSSFTEAIASDVVQVYINEEAAVKFGRLCSAGVAGDIVARLFVVDVVSEALCALFRHCSVLPSETTAGSICSKLLSKMGLDNPTEYSNLYRRWAENPSIIRARVQDMCTLTTIARTTTR